MSGHGADGQASRARRERGPARCSNRRSGVRGGRHGQQTLPTRPTRPTDRADTPDRPDGRLGGWAFSLGTDRAPCPHRSGTLPARCSHPAGTFPRPGSGRCRHFAGTASERLCAGLRSLGVMEPGGGRWQVRRMRARGRGGLVQHDCRTFVHENHDVAFLVQLDRLVNLRSKQLGLVDDGNRFHASIQ
jgi:hypothetical protein